MGGRLRLQVSDLESHYCQYWRSDEYACSVSKGPNIHNASPAAERKSMAVTRFDSSDPVDTDTVYMNWPLVPVILLLLLSGNDVDQLPLSPLRSVCPAATVPRNQCHLILAAAAQNHKLSRKYLHDASTLGGIPRSTRLDHACADLCN